MEEVRIVSNVSLWLDHRLWRLIVVFDEDPVQVFAKVLPINGKVAVFAYTSFLLRKREGA